MRSKSFKIKIIFIEMEEQAVDIADCITVEYTIESSASEDSLWRFCNLVTLPRSEDVFLLRQH